MISGPNSERWAGELWPASLYVRTPKIPIQACQIISTNKHRFACLLIYGDRYLVYGQTHPLLIIFRIALSLLFFWVLGERDSSLFGQIHPCLPPAYFAHTSTASPSLNQYRLQSSRITKPPNCTVPFDSSNSEVV